jgi:hypothetical protein
VTAGCGEPVVNNLAVDPATGNVYVANFCSNNVTVINGMTKTATTVTDPNAAGPVAIAVNPTTDKVYVVNSVSNNVTVIDGGAGTANLTLSVSLSGAGSGGGTVTSVPPGINCPGTCSATFSNGTSVALTASSTAPSTFSIWNGACSGAGGCSINMNANEDVTAYFGISAISVSLSPAVANIQENTTEAFTASVPGDNHNLGVNWKISATCNSGPILPLCSGALTPSSPTSATYFAPNGSVGVSVTLTATSVADITKSATKIFTIAAGQPPDFALSARYTQLTLPTGPPNEVLDQLTVAPGPNFAGTVQLSCAVTGPSPLPTCDAGGSGAIGNGGTWTPTLTIQDPTPAASQGAPHIFQALPQFSRLVYTTWLTVTLAIIFGVRLRKPRPSRLLGSVLLPLLMLMACGGNGTSSNMTPVPKNYTVTVTGTSTASSTSGAYQHTIQVAVTLQ